MGFKTAIVAVDAPTSGTTIDFTSSGFGTTLLAEFFVCAGTTYDTITNDSVLSYGAADGSFEFAVGVQAEHNQTSSDTDRASSITRCCTLLDFGASTYNGELSFNSFITDGVRCDIDNAFSTGFKIIAVLTGGDDVSVDVGQITLPNAVDATQATTAPAFTPDFVKFASISHATDSIATTTWMLSRGVCVNDGSATQRAYSSYRKNAAGTTIHGADLITDGVGTGYTVSGVVDWRAELTSFDLNGFTLTNRDNASGSPEIWYVAVKCPSNSVWAGTYAAPTATGNDAVTAPAFKPQYLELGLSRIVTADTNATDNDSAQHGWSVNTASAQYSVCTTSEDNAGTSVEKSIVDSEAINAPSFDGTSEYLGTLSSFDTNGWTFNFSAVRGSASKWWAFAVEEDAGSGSTLTPNAVTMPLSPSAPTLNASLSVSAVAMPLLTQVVSIGAILTPDPVSFLMVVPALTLNIGLAVSAVSSPLVTVQPVLNITRPVSPVSIVLSVPAVTIVSGDPITPDPVAFSMGPVSVSIEVTLKPDPVSFLFSIPMPAMDSIKMVDPVSIQLVAIPVASGDKEEHLPLLGVGE